MVKNEAAIARRVAEEMGMGSVGKADGLLATAKRMQRKIAGGTVSYNDIFLTTRKKGCCRDQGTIRFPRGPYRYCTMR